MKIESTLPRCRCCGAPLDVIRQKLPKFTLVLVTCWNRRCPMFEFTRRPPEHRRIALRKVRQSRIHGPGNITLRAQTAPKPKIRRACYVTLTSRLR